LATQILEKSFWKEINENNLQVELEKVLYSKLDLLNANPSKCTNIENRDFKLTPLTTILVLQ